MSVSEEKDFEKRGSRSTDLQCKMYRTWWYELQYAGTVISVLYTGDQSLQTACCRVTALHFPCWDVRLDLG